MPGEWGLGCKLLLGGGLGGGVGGGACVGAGEAGGKGEGEEDEEGEGEVGEFHSGTWIVLGFDFEVGGHGKTLKSERCSGLLSHSLLTDFGGQDTSLGFQLDKRSGVEEPAMGVNL